MTTFQTPALLSEVRDLDVPIPKEKLLYFRIRLRQRIYAFLLATFSALEQENKSFTKAKLARRIDKRNEQITRLLGSPNNLELDTLSDLLLGMKKELWFTGANVDDAVITREMELWVSKVLDKIWEQPLEPAIEKPLDEARTKNPPKRGVWANFVKPQPQGDEVMARLGRPLPSAQTTSLVEALR